MTDTLRAVASTSFVGERFDLGFLPSNIEVKLREAQHLVWRNLPGFPSTFGPCARNCGRGLGRGSGPCVCCAQDDLAALVGEEMAAKYVDAVRGIRDLEDTMLHHPNDNNPATGSK